MEAFPAYEEDEEEWEEWKQWNDHVSPANLDLNHCACIIHCEHTLCYKFIRYNKASKSLAKTCNCSTASPPKKAPVNRERIARITEEDVNAAQSAYMGTDKARPITIDLESCCEIVQRMHNIGVLQLDMQYWHDYLLSTSPFINRDYHWAMALSGSRLAGKILFLLDNMLYHFDGYTHSFEIAELERMLKDAMRVEAFWWLSRWVFKDRFRHSGQKRSREQNLRRGFGLARCQWIGGRHRSGVQALAGRLEDVVELVVSVLVWWSRRDDWEGHDEEDGE